MDKDADVDGDSAQSDGSDCGDDNGDDDNDVDADEDDGDDGVDIILHLQRTIMLYAYLGVTPEENEMAKHCDRRRGKEQKFLLDKTEAKANSTWPQSGECLDRGFVGIEM